MGIAGQRIPPESVSLSQGILKELHLHPCLLTKLLEPEEAKIVDVVELTSLLYRPYFCTWNHLCEPVVYIAVYS